MFGQVVSEGSNISFWQQHRNVCMGTICLTLFVGGIIALLIAQYKGHIELEKFAKTTEGIFAFSGIGVAGAMGIGFCICKNSKLQSESKSKYNNTIGKIGNGPKLIYEFEVRGQIDGVNYYEGQATIQDLIDYIAPLHGNGAQCIEEVIAEDKTGKKLAPSDILASSVVIKFRYSAE